MEKERQFLSPGKSCTIKEIVAKQAVNAIYMIIIMKIPNKNLTKNCKYSGMTKGGEWQM